MSVLAAEVALLGARYDGVAAERFAHSVNGAHPARLDGAAVGAAAITVHCVPVVAHLIVRDIAVPTGRLSRSAAAGALVAALGSAILRAGSAILRAGRALARGVASLVLATVNAGAQPRAKLREVGLAALDGSQRRQGQAEQNQR